MAHRMTDSELLEHCKAVMRREAARQKQRSPHALNLTDEDWEEILKKEKENGPKDAA
jgi:hypothetical protein